MTKRIVSLFALVALAAVLAFGQGGINKTTLSSAVDANQTSLYLVAGTSLVPGMIGYIDTEAFQVVAVLPPNTTAAVTVLSIRGYNGTQQTAHVKATPVFVGTATDWANLGAVPGSSSAISATVASGTTITASGTMFHVSGTTTIQTINPPPNFFGGCITLIPDSTPTLGTSGNIKLGSTAVAYKALRECYDANTALWYPSY